ncbi:tetratricopeptide repeat protein [Campylobacterota bacterium]
MNTIKFFIISTLLGGVLMAESGKGLDQAKEALVNEDYKTAFAIFSELADAGDMKAQYFCAGMYELGQSVAKDDVKALHWYIKAAEQGMRDAQQTVAFRYMQGVGTQVDQEKAAYWYDKSARKVSIEDAQALAQWFDPNNTFGFNN